MSNILAVMNAYPMNPISTWDDIEPATSSNALKPYIDGQISNYHTVDIKDAMKQLTRVGELLQLAYAGSKGFTCCSSIVRILADYQTLVKDSFAASSSFVDVSIQALKFHRFAILVAEKGHFKKAIEMMQKTAELAGQMAVICEKLVAESKELADESKKALTAATNDETVTTQKKLEIQNMINDLKAKEVSLSVKSKELAEAVAEEKEREAQAAQEAKEMRQQAFTVAIISTLMTPVTAVVGAVTNPLGSVAGSISNAASSTLQNVTQQIHQLNAQIGEVTSEIDRKKQALLGEKDSRKKAAIETELSSLNQRLTSLNSTVEQQRNQMNQARDNMQQNASDASRKEAEIAKLRAATQKELRDTNSSLAEAVQKLKSANTLRNDLDTAISSLEVTVKSLGRIVTIFGNAKLFWQGVENHCKSLAKVDATLDAEMAGIDEELKIDFINSLKSSGLSWLALGKINRTANLTMRQVNSGIDNIMNNLPNKSETAGLIANLSTTILEELKEETKKLTN